MTVALSARTADRVTAIFEERDVATAAELLEQECGDGLPLWGRVTPEGLERVRFAVLKLSGGELVALADAIRLARRDWRDVLVAAGFADNPNDHLEWDPGAGAS